MKNLLPVFVAVSLLWASAVYAQDSDTNAQARELYNHGIKLYEQGDHTAAAEAFREAYRLRPSYKILFNLGQAEAAASRLGLAMEAFQRYLVDGGDDIPPDRKDYVVTEINRLQALVGDLEVEAPDNSSVYVDGVLRGTTPLTGPVLVVAGVDHEAVVVHENKQLIKQKFKVWATRTHTIKAEKKAPPTVPAEKPAVEEPVEKPVEEPEPVEEEPEEDSEGLDQTYFWIGLGATAAFGAVAIGMDVLAGDKISRVEDDAGNDSLKDDAEMVQNTGIAFMALAGAALVTTGVLAVFTDWGTEKDDADAADSAGAADTAVLLSPWAGGDAGGFSLTGRF